MDPENNAVKIVVVFGEERGESNHSLIHRLHAIVQTVEKSPRDWTSSKNKPEKNLDTVAPQ